RAGIKRGKVKHLDECRPGDEGEDAHLEAVEGPAQERGGQCQPLATFGAGEPPDGFRWDGGGGVHVRMLAAERRRGKEKRIELGCLVRQGGPVCASFRRRRVAARPGNTSSLVMVPFAVFGG